MKHYTYAHFRESDNKVFYIGKGMKQRAWTHSMDKRTAHWHRVKNKHGCKVEILARWDTAEEAFEHEKLMIAVFRDMGHPLVNVTAGGEGAIGVKFDAERLEKHAQQVKNQWAKPGSAIRTATTSTEFKLKMAAVNKEIGTRPEQRAFRSEVAKNNWVVNREKIILAQKKAFATPAIRARKLECAALLHVQNCKPVLCVDNGLVFDSIKDALLWAGKKPTDTGISKCARGQRKTAYGFAWKFLERNNNGILANC